MNNELVRPYIDPWIITILEWSMDWYDLFLCFRLLCKSITIELKQQKTSYVNSVSVDVDIGLVDFVEVLFQGKGVTDSSLGFHFELENVPIYTEVGKTHTQQGKN